MKQYKIVVNGTAYEVEIEEISAKEAAEKKTEAAPKAAEKKDVPAGNEAVTAPIPGTVLQLSQAEGAQVKAGDKLLVMESMKMENEILAPSAGTVSYAVQKGATVAAGDVLATIR